MGSHEMYIDKLNEDITRLTAELAETREEWERFALAVGLADGDQGRYVYATVDEAINEIKRAQSEHLADIDELAAVKEESAETCRKLLEDNHRIEVQLAEAREDTERLDWLCSHALAVTYTGGRNGCAVTWLCDRDGDLRAAIDAGKGE